MHLRLACCTYGRESMNFIQTFQYIILHQALQYVARQWLRFLFWLWCVYLVLTANARLMCSINVGYK